MDMDTIIADWKENAEQHGERNLVFLRTLKRIYAVRPADCVEYPHTDKEGFTFRTYGTADNSLVCPAVFYIVEQLRARGLKDSGR